MIAQSHVIRAAVVQAAPIAFDRERTLAKVRVLTRDAAHQGAQLVVFPEAFVTAYPRGLSFGAVVGESNNSALYEELSPAPPMTDPVLAI